MMTNSKKIVSLLVVSSVILVLLSGCGASKGSGSTEAGSDSAGMLYPAKITYIEEGGDGEGNMVEENRVVRTYTFDDKGNPVSCVKTERDAEMTDTYENTYRDDGTLEKVTGKVGYYDDETGQTDYLDVVREYDEQERLVTKVSDGWIYNYVYNEDGTLKSMEYYTEGGEDSKTVKDYSYEGVNDKDLSMTSKATESWYEEGQLSEEIDESIVTYNKDGYMIKTEYLIDDGLPCWDYDYEMEDGLVTKVSQHYEDSEYYTYTFEYDKNGSGKTMSPEAYRNYINNIFDDIF